MMRHTYGQLWTIHRDCICGDDAVGECGQNMVDHVEFRDM